MLTILDYSIFLIMLKTCTLLGMGAGMLSIVIAEQKRILEVSSLSVSSFVGLLIAFIYQGVTDFKILYIYMCSFAFIMLILLHFFAYLKSINKYIIQSLWFSVLTGVAIFLITYTYQNRAEIDTTMNSYLLGESLTLLDNEYKLLQPITLGAIIFFAVFFTRIKVMLFNMDIAASLRIYHSIYNIIINIFLVLLSAIACRVMGIFLAPVIFIVPALISRLWAFNFTSYLLIAGIVGAGSGFLGAVFADTSLLHTAGISITVVLVVIFVISFIAYLFRTGVVEPLIERLRAFIRTKKALKGGGNDSL